MTLFDLDPEHATEGYRRLLDKGREDDRERLDGMYARAAAFLDANFKDQFARATNDRFFELRLANALLDHDFVLEAAAENRPDFATRLPDGRRLWVEAVSLSWGQPGNPDRAPELKEGLQPAPIREVLLRKTSALKEKRDRFRHYGETGVVAPEDVCVVAMSSGGLHPHVEGVGLPRIVSAVLPFGDEQITIDRATGHVVAMTHERRAELTKTNGAVVPTTAFETPEEYGQISAVLHDATYLGTWRGDLQPARWVTVDNPTALVPPPEQLFTWGTRYRAISVDGAVQLQETPAAAPRPST
ncbi:hypothetical protein [Brevundimonas sp.]|uniref:hypothetical protein n=1 Tax=Brevundimonas sp. TaxID=1871086 RepID=UPI0035B1C5BA